ncbi:MAG: glycosyltransferase family 1 protein [Acidobacteria bacterium]|nr:glycosyltransferase family 1 protein [Acidobacteriota bacterium]
MRRVKLAWFRTDAPRPADPLDDTAALIAALRSTHDIEVFTPANAHDFVWKDFRAPYDLSVCELDNTPAHAFIWPYLLHYGGVLLLRTLILHDSRPAASAPLPDYGHWLMLRVPLLASRVVVVSDPSTAAALQQAHPEARVRYAATGVQKVQKVQKVQRVQASPVMFGAIPANRPDVIHRALARARQAGATAELVTDSSPERVLQNADVIVSLPWPWFGEAQTPALAAIASGTPVIVLETAATAEWPALDPQTWRPRDRISDTPIAVSIDPRDEEHSLALAIRRLSTDATVRARLGGAAHTWWRTHATPRHAADDWDRILAEGARLRPPARPADWPVHLTADGTERARAILDEFSVRVDFL